MKYLLFENFLRQYAKSMSPENTLSLFKSEKLVKDNSRFLSVFTFFLLFDEKASVTLVKHKNTLPTLYSAYTDAQQKYPGLSKENVETKVNQMDSFDELKKAYNSYNHLALDYKVKQKSILYQEIQNIMKQKKISNYKIYNRLHLNPGNTNDFFKNRNLKKMSIEKLKKIHSYCLEN
jgi:predicted XRE-type DNA-binding protein